MNAKERERSNRITRAHIAGGRAALLQRLVEKNIADGNTDAGIVKAWGFNKRVDSIVRFAFEAACRADDPDCLILATVETDCREIDRFVAEELGLFLDASVIRQVA